MASPRELRRRIRSIRSTAQITRAMQMVAASKMRKAQEAALSMRPFARLLYAMQRKATSRATSFKHPLLEAREVRKRAVILVAADKGLCGALNTNVFRMASTFDPASTVFVTAGRKAAQFVARTKRELIADFPYGDTPRFSEARAISSLAREIFLKGDVDEVKIVASRFVNTLTQQPVTIELLPVGAITSLQIEGAPIEEALAADTTEALFEPTAQDVLSYLLPHYINLFIYFVLLNAKASEQSARMVAMKSATDSAEELIADLGLEYNKLRQSNITTELLEIAGGQAGLS
ncbi:MAG TPA: ATP synthase F1 subunit gamma [Vicinamibacterales bacterium]|nr:ATP synthase F1 subunit gamma [Vicinamibacterales bacterium]